MAEKGATQQGVQGEEESNTAAELQNEAAKERQPSEREREMERLAALRTQAVHEEAGIQEPEKNDEPATEAAKEPEKTAASDLSAQSQMLRQLEDGQYLIDDSLLDKAVVRSKVDGREELVPAKKALGQYQKSAAADLRLAEATRMRNEAQALLEQQDGAKSASTPQQRTDAKDAAVNAQAKFKEASQALYEGDSDKASALFAEAVAIAQQPSQGRTESASPNEEDIATRVEQRLSVKSALTKLFTDYPEIQQDSDMTVLADHYRGQFEAEGSPRAEAIVKAGDAIGQKFKLGKYAEKSASTESADPGRQGDNKASTTRAEKLDAKKRLDEPESASARASAPPVQASSEPNRSATIAEMAAQRANGRM